MNRKMVPGIILMVGMLVIGKVAFSDIVRRTGALFFAEPIPCHVYLKRKRAVEKSPHYVPGSFFQAKVQILRMEPDVTGIQETKKFLQERIETEAMQHHKPAEFVERLNEAIKNAEDTSKVLVLGVLETLEGARPGEEIIVSGYHRSNRYYRKLIQDETKRYFLGYQSLDKKTHAVLVSRNDLNVTDGGILTNIKLWVTRLLSECDNV